MKNKDNFYWSKEFAFGEDVPIFSSIAKTQALVEIIELSVKEIKKSNSPRHIILETWLILDYFIRGFIVSGLDVDRFSTQDMDVAFKLLPQSYDQCLLFLENFVKEQNKLPYDIDKNKTDLYGLFGYFVIKKHPEFYNKQFIPIVEEYYKKYYPELVGTTNPIKKSKINVLTATSHILTNQLISKPVSNNKRLVNENWLDIALKLEKKDFFNKARKINTARNVSAHNIQSEYIYKKIGISGKREKTKFNKLKKFCEEQLAELLDVYI